MRYMSSRSMLKKSRLFCHLSGEDLHWLESAMVRRRYAAGQVLFHMGDEGGSLHVITRGRLKVVIPSPMGDEVILTILSAGEILGELSLIDGRPRSATVEALEDTESYCLSRTSFLRFLSLRFEAVLQVLTVLSHRLRATDTLLADAHFLDLQPRLAKKILELARLFGTREEEKIRVDLRLTQRDLAAMVGATRESVNKQIALLRKSKLVRFQDKRITVLDPVRLAGRARLGPGEIGEPCGGNSR
jgi:CRP/FNR family transcriptional regulator/CRP/FNR family cyclic AMP-dependent transcriptional regulator